MNSTAFNIIFFRSSDQSGVLQYEQEQEPEPYEGSEEAERGYLSDVCDYNIVPQQEEKKAKKITSKEEDVGVIHGKLELNISQEKQLNPASRVLQVFITLLFCIYFFSFSCCLFQHFLPLLLIFPPLHVHLLPQADTSYVKTGPTPVVSPSLHPLSPSLSSSLTDRRSKIIQRRASVFSTPPPTPPNYPQLDLTHADLSQATHNPAYVPLDPTPSAAPDHVPSSPPIPSPYSSCNGLISPLQTLAVSSEAGGLKTPEPFQKLTSPFPGRGDISDGRLSRQSSVEQSDMEGKAKRKTSGGKSSAIKNKIQMRKMIKEANKMEIVSGVLSDPDNEVDNDSVEEKQDSEPIDDFERSASSKKLTSPLVQPHPQQLYGVGAPPPSISQLTPETARRMKDWNSRFSNLKHSFDPGSGGEEAPDPSRSPSTQRHQIESSDGEDPNRGRGRFRDRGTMGPRSKSAHVSNTGPKVVVEEYLQTKEDKNKNNTIIAKRASSHPDKDKSPSVRRIQEPETDDEYTQYLCSVDRYRQSNPNPKPFRPITTRTDAIAAPLRKLSDQSGLFP